MTEVDRAFCDMDQEIPRQMPLLEQLIDRYAQSKPLAGTTVLLIQHQLGNQYPEASALLRLGVDPDQLYWIDIPYTANAEVREALQRELKIPEKNFVVHNYSVLQPYSPYQRGRVQDFLRGLFKYPPDHLLVLDDGAYFLEAMATFKERLPHVAIVEQTSRGLIKCDENASLRQCAKQIPLIDVARSNPKKTLESPFIGRSVCAALLRKLSTCGNFAAREHWRCLVLGFGAIGRWTAEYLERNLGCERAHIHVTDILWDRQVDAERLGFPSWDKGDFNTRFDLVLGCSGRASFGLGDYVYLEDGAVLASASSGTVELSRQEFIELADASQFDDIEVIRTSLKEEDIHSDLHFRLVDRNAVFLNGGFPVNFDGRVNCVPPRYIQASMAMMVAGAIQASRASLTDIISLDKEFCDWVDTAFRAELGDEASELPPP